MTSAARRGASIARWFLEWLKSIAIALVVWLFLRTFVVEAFTIPSGSMENTLLIGDFLFVNKFLYGAEVPLIHTHLPEVREPERGDILVFDSVEGDGMKIVKRLIGIPGDTIAMRHGTVYRNGAALDEPYAVSSDPMGSADLVARARMRDWQVKHFAGRVPPRYDPDLHDWGPVIVPHDSLFVMGDNRDDSYDGRYWGFLPRANVLGRPLLVYFSYNPESLRKMAFLTRVRWNRLFTVPR
ncbi:MAG TPA: signal peptidase I [Gemmatimonadales bacterium]|jgi:signal peptidase I